MQLILNKYNLNLTLPKLGKIFVAMALMVFIVLTSTVAQAEFGFDEMEELEQAEQSELLQLASDAAKNWQFNQAEAFLNEAQYKNYAPGEVEQVKGLIADNRATKAEKERLAAVERERVAALERERVAALERERQRQYNIANNNSLSSGSESSTRSYCSSRETCYNIIDQNNSEIDIRCSKGYKIGSETTILYDSSNGKYYYRGFLSNTYEKSFKKLANFYCGAY